MKQDNSRTFDFCEARHHTRRPGGDRRVSSLLVDGWSAYYRWLAELKNRLTESQSTRQPD